MLALSELTPIEKEQVQRELLQDVRVKRIDFTGDMDEEIFDQVYLEVLTEWGVSCPHPSSSVKPIQGGRAWECAVCGCLIISGRDPGRRAAGK